MNKKGFIVIETIIVMSILAIGLIGLYSSYTLIVKNSKANSNVVNNTFLALQISEYKKYTTTNTNTYYIEIYDNNTQFRRRECNTTNCTSSSILSTEEYNIYKNLNIDKIYISTKTFSDLYNSNVILNMDGSTINYLQSIKNNPDIKKDESIIIIKVKNDNINEFSFYQESEYHEKGILTNLILKNTPPTKPLTTPGVNYASSSEKLISSTMDDYGLSYYYRGRVQNNFLVFANMCWRIVRITGKGDIKIALYNYNPNNASNPCLASEDGTDRAFARYDNSENGTVGKSLFNSLGNNNTYFGFMYGDTTGTYEDILSNETDSVILTNLKTWYDAKFTSSEKDMLADVIWCNDKSFDTNTYNLSTWGGSTRTDYSGKKRIEPDSTATPSLVCPNFLGTNENMKKISKFTASDTTHGNGSLNGYKIGLLTVDEVAFAGSQYSYGSSNSNYLQKNASSVDWWTMTPSYYSSYAYVYKISSTSGKLMTANVASGPYGIRPAVALKSGTLVSGSGTQDDPYIVME